MKKSRIEVARRVLRRGVMFIVPFAAVLFSPLLLGDEESKAMYAGMIGVAFFASFLIAGLALMDGKE